MLKTYKITRVEDCQMLHMSAFQKLLCCFFYRELLLGRMYKSKKFLLVSSIILPHKFSDIPGEEASKIKFINGDVRKKETLEPACNNADAVICSVGATVGWRLPGSLANTPRNVDYLGVKNLSEVAASAKVRQIYLLN